VRWLASAQRSIQLQKRENIMDIFIVSGEYETYEDVLAVFTTRTLAERFLIGFTEHESSLEYDAFYVRAFTADEYAA
jgi:hypothetical protein